MMNGIINVLKPPGMTSHDVVSFIRRTYGIKKVGHAGTLDPAAAGVLPVALGQATRLLEYMTDCDKSYRTELTLGYETNTGDDTGEILFSKPFTTPNSETLEEILDSFIGTSSQIPPMYSAIKIDGKKMYDLARAGLHVELKPRTVTIHSIKLIHQTATSILFDVSCSKGTYIRSLCADIGKLLGGPVVMSFLVRTRVGLFILEDSYTLEEIAEKKESILLPSETAIKHFPKVILTAQDAVFFQNGQKVANTINTPGIVRVYTFDNLLLGIGMQDSTHYISPVKVLSRF